MPENLPHDWEISPRCRVLDSVVRGSHGGDDGRWQLHLVRSPVIAFGRVHAFDNDDGFVIFNENADREYKSAASETSQLATQLRLRNWTKTHPKKGQCRE